MTTADVEAAIREFDDLGRDRFLRKYGFGEARGYFLVWQGREYDSKAVVGAAHALRHGERLLASEFNGGDAKVKRLLEELGFEVRVQRNPPWTRDEVVLACDLVRENSWRYLNEEDRSEGRRTVAGPQQLAASSARGSDNDIPQPGWRGAQDRRHRNTARGLPGHADQGRPARP